VALNYMRIYAPKIRAQGAARCALSRGHLLSHAKHMAIRATRRVTNHDDPTTQHAEADDSGFAVPLPAVLDFKCRSSEDNLGVLENLTRAPQEWLSASWDQR
jgi:hypothetical protein